MPETDLAWLLDTNILLRMSKSDDPHYPVISMALQALVRRATLFYLADPRRVLECVHSSGRQKWIGIER